LRDCVWRCERCRPQRGAGRRSRDASASASRVPRRRGSVTRRVLCSCSCGLRRPTEANASSSGPNANAAFREEDHTTDPAQGAGSREPAYERGKEDVLDRWASPPAPHGPAGNSGREAPVVGLRSTVVVRARMWCPVHVLDWTIHA